MPVLHSRTAVAPFSRRRFESLDGLRAIACLLVIWQHVSESFVSHADKGLWATEQAAYFDFGRVGVIAFFCISGFVIPHSLHGSRLGGARRFLINRFFRLYPIYWLSIPLGILSVWTIWGRAPDAATVWANITMGMTFLDEEPIMGLYWTLEIELVFYLLCTLLHLCFGRLSFAALAAAFLMCNWAFREELLIHQPGSLPLLFYFLSIMLACSCARCAYELELTAATDRWLRALHWLAVALMFKIVLAPAWRSVVTSFSQEEAVWSRFGYGHGLGILLFLFALFLPGLSGRFSAVGRATYSAYLLHAVVFSLLLKIWSVYDLPQTRMELFILAVSLATFALAFFSYRYVELPSIGLGKRLARQETPS